MLLVPNSLKIMSLNVVIVLFKVCNYRYYFIYSIIVYNFDCDNKTHFEQRIKCVSINNFFSGVDGDLSKADKVIIGKT